MFFNRQLESVSNFHLSHLGTQDDQSPTLWEHSGCQRRRAKRMAETTSSFCREWTHVPVPGLRLQERPLPWLRRQRWRTTHGEEGGDQTLGSSPGDWLKQSLLDGCNIKRKDATGRGLAQEYRAGSRIGESDWHMVMRAGPIRLTLERTTDHSGGEHDPPVVGGAGVGGLGAHFRGSPFPAKGIRGNPRAEAKWSVPGRGKEGRK